MICDTSYRVEALTESGWHKPDYVERAPRVNAQQIIDSSIRQKRFYHRRGRRRVMTFTSRQELCAPSADPVL
jgi:hypothetical protein